jgi:pimeloyl-ACP methyl ester carboxylesterase
MSYRGMFTVFCVAALLAVVPAMGEDSAGPAESEEVLAPFDHREFTLADGKQMNSYQRAGDGACLVLVPGTWGDVHRFTPLIAELPADMPIVVIELCWQGGHVPPALDMTIESLADDVLWVVKELGVERFYIGGHSIGGMIAVEIAGRDVPGLVGAVPMEGWTHHTVVDTAFDGLVVGALSPEEQVQSQGERAKGRAHLTEDQWTAIGQIWKGWNGYEALVRSKIPVLHVWGDRGKPHPTREAMQIPDRPSIEIAWMPDASHHVVMETPKELAKAIVDFVKRTE